MAERGFGRIIHISSQQAHRAFVQSGAYGVSTGARESLSRSQAEAWSPYGVTCNLLVPGFVMTPLDARLSGDPTTAGSPSPERAAQRRSTPTSEATASTMTISCLVRPGRVSR